MIHKTAIPPFIEFTNIHVDQQLILHFISEYKNLEHRKNQDYEYSFVSLRPELASHFPFKDDGYDYIPVTDIDEALKETRINTSPTELYKLAQRGKAPAMDCRNYTNVKDDISTITREFMSRFKSQVSRTRYAVLKSKMTIYEHIDNGLNHTVRIHVPLISDPKVLFGVRTTEGIEMKHLEVGKVYFVDTSRPHLVINSSNTDRLHLILNLNSMDDILEYL